MNHFANVHEMISIMLKMSGGTVFEPHFIILENCLKSEKFLNNC